MIGTALALTAAGVLALGGHTPGTPFVADEGGLVRASAPRGVVTMPALSRAVMMDQRMRTRRPQVVKCRRAPAPGYGARAYCRIKGAEAGGSPVRYWEDGSWRFEA